MRQMTTVHDDHSFRDFIEVLRTLDVLEWVRNQRPNSKCFFHCLIQAQVTVTRINAPVELPSYISNNQSIIGLTKSRKTGESYRDNLFLFRCGCHHLMKKRDERKTKKRLCSMVPSCLSCSKPFDDSENIQSLFDLKLIGQVFLNSYVKENTKRAESSRI